MKKKISMFVINVVFVGLIAVICTSLALTYIRPTAENVTHDTAISQPDTLSFEAEMAIVDSIIDSQVGNSYENYTMIPNQEINFDGSYRQQTLIRYPNGMPKITVMWSNPEKKSTRYVILKGALFFYSDNGHPIAYGDKHGEMPSYKWRCVTTTETVDGDEVVFVLSNPNICRNIMQH